MKIAIIIFTILLTALTLISFLKKDLIKRTALHVWCDWLATTIVGFVTYKLIIHHSAHPNGISILISFIAGIGAAWGKEYIWDKDLKLGVTNPVHAWYSTWGCLLGIVTIFVTFMAIDGNGV